MTFGCVGPGSIALVSGFRYFVLSVFRYFVFFGISVNRCPGIYRFRFLGMCRQFFSCRIFLSLSTSLRSLSIWRSF